MLLHDVVRIGSWVGRDLDLCLCPRHKLVLREVRQRLADLLLGNKQVAGELLFLQGSKSK